MKQCPNCSKSVPDDSWLCDCGYEFSSTRITAGTDQHHGMVHRSTPVCRFSASLLAIPVCISLFYLLFVLMPSAHGASGPDVGPDLRGVFPFFTILICGGLGSIFSIAGMRRH